MTSQHQEQLILEYCQWLFDQEVRIITFIHYIPDEDYDEIIYRKFIAIVLPKDCSLQSLADSDINKNILIDAQDYNPALSGEQPTRESVINLLLTAVERKIGEIIKPKGYRTFQVEETAIPNIWQV